MLSHTTSGVGTAAGATHPAMSNLQLVHFSVPVYPVPSFEAHVCPARAVPSQSSVPSMMLLPHTGAQSNVITSPCPSTFVVNVPVHGGLFHVRVSP